MAIFSFPPFLNINPIIDILDINFTKEFYPRDIVNVDSLLKPY